MKKLLVLILLVAGGAGLGAWYAFEFRHNGDGALKLSGNIEATEVNISFKIPGRVEKRFFDEGQSVLGGQEVARLDTADLDADVAARKADIQVAQAALDELLAGSRPDEINAARAAMDKARAALTELQNGSRPEEIAAADAEQKAAQADMERLGKELERAEQLYRQHTITPEQHDQARAAYQVAFEKQVQARKRYDLVKEGPRQEQIEQARAALGQVEAQYRLVKEGPRIETIAQGRAKVEQAKAAGQLAQVRRSYASVCAPVDESRGEKPIEYVVLSKNVEPGEYVAPGTPLVTIADIKNIWLRAYVDERDVGTGRVKWGQEAEVTTDSYPNKVYKGWISFIASEEEFTPKNVQTEKERVKLVYRIKINVDNPDRELKPGMPADARLLPTVRAAPPATQTPATQNPATQTPATQSRGFPKSLNP
ncbi:MAG: efflux RND transporter periplasmic adaptor subunit [Thermoguttaceae bacterium]|jgi:HlyD family secretion protein